MTEQHRGTIKHVRQDKGYFFITPDAAMPDVFGHVRGPAEGESTLIQEGDRVFFDLTPSKRHANRFEAVNIEVQR
jgi:cold shock CspA family protein